MTTPSLTTPPLTPAMVAQARTLAGPRFSPDGRLLAWVEGLSGRADLVVAPVDGSGPPVVVTADAAADSSGDFTWADGGRQLVYVAADGRLVAVPAAGGRLRCLSRDGEASAPAASPDGTRVAFVLERDDACEIATVPLDGSAWPARVSTGADWSIDPAWSADGRLLAWHEWDFPDMPWDASRIVVRPVEGTTPSGPPDVVAGGDGVACGQPRFSPDGSSLAFVCDRTGWMNVWVAVAEEGAGKETRRSARPLLEEEHEHAEATWGPGQRSFAWSPDGASVVLCRNEAGFGRLVVVPAVQGAGREIGRGWHHGLDWGPGAITALRSGVRTPPQVVVLQPDGSGRRSLVQGPANAVAAARPIEPEAVTWEGDDGGTVQGLLYRPATSALGPGTAPPLLVYVHGGPTGMAAAAWFPRHQFWLSRGWAVLTPNFRGSTGYGRAYTQALTGRWGELDVADVAAGIRHAGQAGWADPRRVALDGGSAGGFTLLLVCARHPGLVRAGVDRYGVTDLFDLAETTHRYESRYCDRLVGPLPAAADQYRERSPVNQAEKIAVPLLVLQGDNDKVVPKAQADALVDALRRRDTPVEYHVYEGEGHGWSRPETVADELERSERFLTRWVLKR
jgi:dipeptidyl aminopeptidase/acylaminoacyl peptidase